MATNSAMKTCISCGKSFSPDKFHPYQRFCSKRCKWRWHSRNGRKMKRYHELRFQAIEALDGKCAICGINDKYMLTIDHIYRDWEKDPFSRRNKRALYRHILEDLENAKKHFQVLCWNHNSMKALYPEVFAERYSVARQRLTRWAHNPEIGRSKRGQTADFLKVDPPLLKNYELSSEILKK